jgi:hypothetical protein
MHTAAYSPLSSLPGSLFVSVALITDDWGDIDLTLVSGAIMGGTAFCSSVWHTVNKRCFFNQQCDSLHSSTHRPDWMHYTESARLLF